MGVALESRPPLSGTAVPVPESGSVQTPSVQTRLPPQSFVRVHGAFRPLSGESDPPQPGSRRALPNPNALNETSANATAFRTTLLVYPRPLRKPTPA